MRGFVYQQGPLEPAPLSALGILYYSGELLNYGIKRKTLKTTYNTTTSSITNPQIELFDKKSLTIHT